MDIQFAKEWKEYTSATLGSTASNNIISAEGPFTKTYRTYIKPREYGKFMWKCWHSNNVDSTWDDGSYSHANLPGGNWIIEAAYIADGGSEIGGKIVSGSNVQITFNGEISKEVLPGEKFWSDAVELQIEEGHYLVFTWTLTAKMGGKLLPYNIEALLMAAYSADGNCAAAEESEAFTLSEGCTVLPHLIAYKRPVKRKIGFFGDSITQGVRTTFNAYEYWVAKIGEGLGVDYGVWNIGCGWARAYDAATDGDWLYKAKQNDEVVICLGVNDIGTGRRSYEQLFGDLSKIVGLLKENNPKCIVTLCTVPPFDFLGEEADNWRRVNAAIRAKAIAGVDWVFDIADVLSKPAPEENLERVEFKSANGEDGHPNGLAGTKVAERFLKEYFERK